ncbi:MAG: beta-ketoacyl synthase chain length factor [Bacteroidia bacterium]
MKRLYIHSASSISPQSSDKPVREFTPLTGPGIATLSCIEPDYKTRIDAKMIRRMSRIIRMGFYTALESLEAAGDIRPGAIISATGLGCLEDTGVFIEKLINNREEMLSPTAFIQSTHNAVAAQIALSMQNHGYNHTWVQGGISFECALDDAALWASEHPGQYVLLTAADEVTNYSLQVLKRFGLAGGEEVADGITTGEGAVSLIVSTEKGNSTITIDACETIYTPDDEEKVVESLQRWAEQSLSRNENSILLSGETGAAYNGFYTEAVNFIRPSTIVAFKQYCGEYPVSSGFAVWTAWKALLENLSQTAVIVNRDPRGYCSFLVLRRC